MKSLGEETSAQIIHKSLSQRLREDSGEEKDGEAEAEVGPQTEDSLPTNAIIVASKAT